MTKVKQVSFKLFLLSLTFNVLLVFGAYFTAYRAAKIIDSKNQWIDASSSQADIMVNDKNVLEGMLDKNELTIKQKEELIAQRNAELDKANKDLDKSKQDLASAQKDLAAKLSEIKKQTEKIKNQESQLATNSQELNILRSRPPLFSFQNKSSRGDIEGEEADVRALVENAYSSIENIFGSPYLLHKITISFVDSLSRDNASGETYIKNGADGLEIDIRLKSFDKNSFQSVNMVIHELVHSFHGVAILMPVAYEEGIAVATADMVMDSLQAAGKISISQRFLDHNARDVYIPMDNSSFYSGNDVYDRYQKVGEAWWDIEKAHPETIKKFNELWYSHIRDGEDSSQVLIRGTLSSVCGDCNLGF